MKRIIVLIASLTVLISFSSCGSLSKLSYEDAYNLGYNLGYYGSKLLNN